ncbi:MAG: nitrilase-related carbon-nitrogen hydrolase [Actinomycetota bacterium]
MRIACVQLRARDVSEADRALEEAVGAATKAARRADLVVLPEATYPAYVLHDPGPYLDPRWYQRGRAAFADVASREGAWVAVGLVRPEGHALFNSAVLLDPGGRTAATADKVFLWHFDSQWFRPGRPGEVVPLPWGAAGMFVCADARMVEVPRRLGVAGARLLLDPTALVLSPAGINAQVEYLLSARAWENGGFLAVANKCGVEAGIASYAGRSAIYGPDGRRVAEAGAEQPETIVAEVDLAAAPGPPAARDPGGYPELSAPPDSLPIAEVLSAPPPARPLRVAMLSGATARDRAVEELAPDVAIQAGADGLPELVPLGGEGGARAGPTSGTVVAVGGARIGLLAGDRGLVPEEVRVLMLRGASVVVWHTGDTEVPAFVARTRADENRVFLVTIAGDGAWRVFGPSGTPFGSGPAPGIVATLVELPLALAWFKEMAPGTDVVRGRTPSHFDPLALS